MIVKFTIKQEIYDKIKFGVPASIIANIRLPESEKPNGKDEKYPILVAPYSYAVREACEKFILTNSDDHIRATLDAIPAEEDSDFRWDYEVLAPYSMEPPVNENGDIISMALSPTHDVLKSRLHADDVIPHDVAMALNDNVCMCCQLNEDIWEMITKVQGENNFNCPVCGAVIHTRAFEFAPVQEANYYEPQHHIGIYPICQCSNCGNTIALIPTEIDWNANHDVWYTGGAAYMASDFTPESAGAEVQKIFDKHLWPSIKQFVERKLHPESGIDAGLDIDFNLKLWTERDFAHAITEYFYNRGMKE